MPRFRPFLFSTIALLLSAASARPASISTTGGQFLKIPVGVRSAAMGDSFSSVADDATATSWNTAGLAQLEEVEIHAYHASIFQSINYEYLGTAIPIGTRSVLGLSGGMIHTPSFNSTNNPLALPGEASDLFLGAGFSRRFGSTLYFGLGAKFIQSKLMAATAKGLAFDAGLMLSTKNKKFTLSLAAQNLGRMSAYAPLSTKENLPGVYRAGLSARFWPKRKVRPLFSVEVHKAVDEKAVFHTGTEIWVGPTGRCIAFRAGYQSNDLTRDLGGSVGTAFGTGIRYQSMEFNYAFVPFGILGNTQRFSVAYRFGGAPPLPDAAMSRSVSVDVKSEVADLKMGSVKTAAFDLKPQARTNIKNWALDITDSKGNVLRRYSGKGVPPRSLVWDGKDDQGNVVTGGLFSTYNLRTIDKKGQQVIASEPLFKVGGADVALRQVDPRVLAQHPEVSAMLGLSPSAAPAPPVEAPPVIPSSIQPVGELGVLKMPSLPFQTRTSDWKPGSLKYLDQVAALIRKYPTAKVYIEGHAYDEGPEAECVALSQRRADAVLRYLVEVGKVASDRLYSRGHGSSAPLDVARSEAARARNRRVDIVILTK